LAVFDFRSKNPPPVYQGRAYQRRLIYMVVGLAMVLYLMWQARDARNWRWFELLSRPRVAEVDTTVPLAAPGQDSSNPKELPEAVLVPAKRQAPKPDRSKPLAERVRGDLLRKVSDQVADFDPQEADAFLHLLEILREAEPQEIRAARPEEVTHLQLWGQSSAYRGKLVSMTGAVRLVRPRTLPANDYGVSEYYEVWMHPDGSSNPVVICALELPPEFPREGKLDEPATVRGFYYRRWWYMAGDKDKPETVKARRAPMLLARGIDWNPRQQADLRTSSARWDWVSWAIGGVVVAVILGVMLARRLSRESPPDYIRARMKGDDVNVASGDAGKRDVHADLRNLSQTDETSGSA
jgi:hypothetical protein